MGRALKRAYTALSCALTAALVAGGAFAELACWVAPTLLREVRRDAASVVMRFANIVSPPEPGGIGAEPPAPAPAGAAGPAARKDGGSPIDVAALEARLRELDRSFPAGHGALLPPSAEDGEMRRSLEAWETLRRPLVAFLEAEEAIAGSRRARGKLDGGAPIAAIAPTLAASLDALAGARRSLGLKLIGGIESSTVARLVSSGTLSSAEALQVLSMRPPSFGAEVIEKVSRIDPRRGASLLEAVLHEEPATASGDEAAGRARARSRERDEKSG